jgi:hypothetical protein
MVFREIYMTHLLKVVAHNFASTVRLLEVGFIFFPSAHVWIF